MIINDSKFFMKAPDVLDEGVSADINCEEKSKSNPKRNNNESLRPEYTKRESNSDFRLFFNIPENLDGSGSHSPVLEISDDAVANRIRCVAHYPTFNRSPHIKTEVEKLELRMPQKDRIGDKPEYNWVTSLLPQAAMLIVMVAVFFFSGVGSLAFTVPMYCVTIFTGIMSFLSQKRKYKKRSTEAETKYTEALSDLQAEIESNKKEQMEVLFKEYPSIEECQRMVREKTDWLWRIRPDEDGFLDLRVGIGTIPSKITVHIGYNMEVPEIFSKNSSIIEDVPVSCPIANYGSVGVTGNRNYTMNIVRGMIVQAATNHCYDELKIVVFYPATEHRQWDWVKWIPHVWSSDRQSRYIANTRDDAKKLCKELEDIIIKRVDTNARSIENSSNYLVIVADLTLVADQTLVNYLSSANNNLRLNSVFMASDRSKLPSACNAIIEVSGPKGKWYPINNTNDSHEFRPDTVDVHVCDNIARFMAPIRLKEGAGGSKMPRSVTFLEGYGVQKVEELDIANLWKSSNYGKSLAVPLGIRNNGECFYFDINRKKDGPHGMVAGGTGSGKSDIVQSWILSMALHFKPTEVSFIIVDYKGDGLLAPFRRLPHLVGTISNLDHNVERNVSALRSELERRQILFKESGAHNIEDYIEQYKHGEINKSLPYLIVVIDEFADFKANHPEFMPIVNEIYTKGASLGVYCLVLAQDATAAATGSVIPVNSHFHWCMKVDSDEASTGMLGTHDAYTMTKLPGRGYVKIGNFEVYEKIQAFWSGAYYNPLRNEDTVKIPPIARVALNGTRTRFSGTLDWEKSIGLWSSVKEIDEVVDYICQYAEDTKAEIPSQIWQPPIPQNININELLPERFADNEWPESAIPEVILGVADDPGKQRQYVLSYSFSNCGHISIQGGPESGKTTCLTTAAVCLAQRYSPKDLEIYLFDYDKWSLNLIRNLPHVKGSSAAAEPDEIREIVKSVQDELSRRRILFLKAGAISLEGYNDLGQTLPAIILIVDNISAAWDDNSNVQEMLYAVAQKGAGYGIYIIASAPGINFPYKLTGFFKTKLTLRQNERSDYNSIVGRTDLTPENYPGRGLAKIGYPVEIQIALPADGKSEVERNHRIHDMVEEMRTAWETVEMEITSDVYDWKELGHIGDIILGIDKKMMDPILFSEAKKHCLLISSMDEANRNEILWSIANQILAINNSELVVFDTKDRTFKDIESQSYFVGGDSLADEYVSNLMEVLTMRSEGKGKNETGKYSPIYLMIVDWKEFFDSAADDTIVYLRDIVEMANGLSVYLVVGGLNEGIAFLASNGEKLTNRLLKHGHVMFSGGSIRQHNLLQTMLSTEEENAVIPDGFASYVLDSKVKSMYLLKERII